MHVAIDFPEVVHERVDGEVVVVNFKNGRYYSFENVGSQVWSCIENGLDTDTSIARMMAQYEGTPEEIATGVNEFVAELLKEGLVKPVESAPLNPPTASPAPPPATQVKSKFQPPELLKFKDMEGLLLLDVAHDEDAQVEN